MIIEIPITGTVLVEGTMEDGWLTGDPNDPLRPVDLNLGNINKRIISYDLGREIAVVVLEPVEEVYEKTGELDKFGEPIYEPRLTTQEEKTSFLQYAQGIIMNHTRDER